MNLRHVAFFIQQTRLAAHRAGRDADALGAALTRLRRAAAGTTESLAAARLVAGTSDDEALLREGNSKSKAGAIANAAARDGRSAVGERGGGSGSYEDWTKDD
ncbi:DUF7218 family protein, partial [Morganella psychrotolerans]|uniref:DUF7218 family protein n=1 Tax=Morganella psychrotolerans TaxID=368603 RepID=UPI003CD06172